MGNDDYVQQLLDRIERLERRVNKQELEIADFKITVNYIEVERDTLRSALIKVQQLAENTLAGVL